MAESIPLSSLTLPTGPTPKATESITIDQFLAPPAPALKPPALAAPVLKPPAPVLKPPAPVLKPPAPVLKPPALLNTLGSAVKSVESGNDRSAVGKLGERSEWQVLPSTAKNPGFEIPPAADDSLEAIAKVGENYLAKMYEMFDGNIPHTLAAYNMGPNATREWISKGADLSRLPRTTREYIEKVQMAMDGADTRQTVSAAQQGPGRLLSGVGQFAQGYVAVPAGIPETVAIKAQQDIGELRTVFDEIDRGEISSIFSPSLYYRGAFSGFARDYYRADASERKKMRKQWVQKDPRTDAFYKAGETMRKKVSEMLPVNYEYQDEFTQKLAAGFGSAFGFIQTEIMARLLRLPPGLSTAGVGASTSASATFRDALREGASIEDATKASNLSALVGTTEAVPVARVLNRFDKATGGSLSRILKEGFKGGVEELTQETFQSVMDNLIASKFIGYDPDRGMLHETGESGAVGFTVGSLFSMLATMLGARVRSGPRTEREEREELKPDIPPLDQQQTISVQEIDLPIEQPAAPVDATVDAPVEPPVEAPAEARAPPSPGEKTTVYTPDGKTLELEVVAVSEAGTAVIVKDPEGNEVLVDEHLYGLENPLSPDRIGEVYNKTVKSHSDAELDHAINREQTKMETRIESGQPALFFLRNLNALKVEKKRRAGGAAQPTVTEPAAPVQPTSAGRDEAKIQAHLLDLTRAVEQGDDFQVRNLSSALSDMGATAEEINSTIQDMEPYYRPVAQQTADLPEIVSPTGQFEQQQTLALSEIDLPIAQSQKQNILSGIGWNPGKTHRSGDPSPRERVDEQNPIRRETILNDFLAGLGHTIYEGNVRRTGVLGFYDLRTHQVRIKVHGDLGTAAHEMAHFLDYKYKLADKVWNRKRKDNADIRRELQDISYDQGKLYEGFAEFVRHWMTDPDYAKLVAPETYKWWTSWVENSGHAEVLKRAQTDMVAWFSQTDSQRARSKIGETIGINDHMNSIWDYQRQKVFDDLHAIGRMEETLTGKVDSHGAYVTARLLRGWYGVVEGALKYGAPVVHKDGHTVFTSIESGGRRWNGLLDILQPVGDRLDDFLLYITMKSARELYEQNRENMFTVDEIVSGLRLQNDIFDASYAAYLKWNEAIVDFAEAKGVVNPTQRKAWRRLFYLPFYRVTQKGAGADKVAQVPGAWRGVKALTGGTGNLRPILGNIIQNASMWIRVGLENEVRAKVANLAKKGGGQFMVEIPKGVRKTAVPTAQITTKFLNAFGVRDINDLPIEVQIAIGEMEAQLGAFTDVWVVGQTPTRKNVVAHLVRGKPVYNEVADPLLFRALMALHRPSKNWLVRILGAIKMIGQRSVTISIRFVLRNVFRDTILASILSPHGFKIGIDSAKGLKSVMVQDEHYKEFVANGGAYASHMMDEDVFRYNVDLRNFYTKRGINLRSVIHTPRKMYYALTKLTESTEMATRLGEYRQARKKGFSPAEASFAAGEVSTDFRMRGDSVVLGFLYDTIIFLKPAMNGLDRVYRAFTKDEHRGSVAIKSAALAGASAVLYMINRGNPAYDDLEEWDKNAHWHFIWPQAWAIEHWYNTGQVPEGKIQDVYHHYRIPKIWEIGAMASIAERTAEGILDKAPKRAGIEIFKVLYDTFRIEFIPHAFSPLMEQATNKLRFFDRPILTEGQKTLEPWARTSVHTSPTLRAWGEFTRKADWMPDWMRSPKNLEALLRSYLNAWAGYGLSITDGLFFDNQPDLRLDQYPGLNVFLRQHPLRNTKSGAEFYEFLEAAVEARRTMRDMAKQGKRDIAFEIREKDASKNYAMLSSYATRLQAVKARNDQMLRMKTIEELQNMARSFQGRKEYAAEIKKMRNNPDVWNDIGAMKRKLQDMFTERRNKLTREAVRKVEKGM